MHSAKGLEFPLVFLCGMEDGLFPHQRSIADPQGLEEERRLCYVGITRAKQNLYLTYAEQRRLHGMDNYSQPSRFIAEIPDEYIEEIRPRVQVSRPAPTSHAGSASRRRPWASWLRACATSFRPGSPSCGRCGTRLRVIDPRARTPRPSSRNRSNPDTPRQIFPHPLTNAVSRCHACARLTRARRLLCPGQPPGLESGWNCFIGISRCSVRRIRISRGESSSAHQDRDTRLSLRAEVR